MILDEKNTKNEHEAMTGDQGEKINDEKAKKKTTEVKKTHTFCWRSRKRPAVDSTITGGDFSLPLLQILACK